MGLVAPVADFHGFVCHRLQTKKASRLGLAVVLPNGGLVGLRVFLASAGHACNVLIRVDTFGFSVIR